MHSELPAVENVPAVQFTHSCPPIDFWPAGQFEQFDDPTLDEFPALQLVQEEAPYSEKVPAGHLRQEDFPD